MHSIVMVRAKNALVGDVSERRKLGKNLEPYLSKRCRSPWAASMILSIPVTSSGPSICARRPVVKTRKSEIRKIDEPLHWSMRPCRYP